MKTKSLEAAVKAKAKQGAGGGKTKTVMIKQLLTEQKTLFLEIVADCLVMTRPQATLGH